MSENGEQYSIKRRCKIRSALVVTDQIMANLEEAYSNGELDFFEIFEDVTNLIGKLNELREGVL